MRCGIVAVEAEGRERHLAILSLGVNDRCTHERHSEQELAGVERDEMPSGTLRKLQVIQIRKAGVHLLLAPQLSDGQQRVVEVRDAADVRDGESYELTGLRPGDDGHAADGHGLGHVPIGLAEDLVAWLDVDEAGALRRAVGGAA